MIPGFAQENESEFSVLIPKVIVLQDSMRHAVYSIQVKGIINKEVALYVQPQSSLVMNDTDKIKKSVEGQVLQEKQKWYAFELNAETYVSQIGFAAAKLSEGQWEDHLNFEFDIIEIMDDDMKIDSQILEKNYISSKIVDFNPIRQRYLNLQSRIHEELKKTTVIDLI